MAMAVKNSGGVVIVQVERIARSGSLNPRQVLIPGVLVDCVVVAEPEHHRQTYATAYNPAYSAETSVPLDVAVGYAAGRAQGNSETLRFGASSGGYRKSWHRHA